ncbi:MAG: carboxypeptidase-like regulatory domain-containing protein, partial [Patescibacteria group bacterium]
GYTHEIIDGEEAILNQTQVTLYSVIGGQEIVWDGSPFGQMNPMTSTLNGTLAWYVPNGQYRVHAEKDGYKPLNTAVFTVSNFIATPRVVMIPLQKKEIVSQETANASVIPLTTQAVVKSFKKTVKTIAAIPAVQTINQGVEAVREIPGVQTAAQASLPTLAVSAGASVVVMSVAFDFLPFIQYLFTAPFLFFGRKKRKGFGVIYNAISKEPIGLAVVRLFQLQNEQDLIGKLVKSRVTDRGGRFFFLVQPGMYRLTITKNGFQFPSEHMKGKKEDVQYIDLYHGEHVKVAEKDAVLTPNIPLDPSTADQYHEPKQIILRARLQFIQHIVALSGTVASFVFAIIRP